MVSLRKMKMKSIRTLSFKTRGKKNKKTNAAAGEVGEEWSGQSTPTQDVSTTDSSQDANLMVHSNGGDPDASLASWFSSAAEEERACAGAGERGSSPVPSPAPSPGERDGGDDAAAAEVRGARDDPPPIAKDAPPAPAAADDGTVATEVSGASGASDATARVSGASDGPPPVAEDGPSASGAAPRADDRYAAGEVGSAGDDGGPAWSVRVVETRPSEDEAGGRTHVLASASGAAPRADGKYAAGEVGSAGDDDGPAWSVRVVETRPFEDEAGPPAAAFDEANIVPAAYGPAVPVFGETDIVSPACNPAVTAFDKDFNEEKIFSPEYRLPFCGCFGV